MMRMRSMSDGEKSDAKRSVTIASVGYIFATVIYGVCLQEVHAHSKELKPLHRGFEVPILQTAAGFVSLLFLVKLESLKDIKNHYEGIIVTYLCHLAMEYLFNFWYIYARHDSFAIGYFEPLLLILFLKVCIHYDTDLKIVALLVSMAIIAGLTSGDVWMLSNASRSGIIIFLVIYFVSLQNLGIRLLQEECVNFSIRKKFTIIYTVSILLVGFILSAFHLTYWALPLMFALIAMFASVAMFYLTAILLEHCHMITLSVLGVVAQIFVNLACVPGEHVHSIVITIVAVMILTCAIILYFRFMSLLEKSSDLLVSSVPHHEVYTRMQFLMFAGVFCGILFYVFKPKFSERDLNNLHYVGLDKIVKLLLNRH